MAAGDRAILNKMSTLMLRAFERRINSPPTILRTLAQDVSLKDGITDQITNLIPMNYTGNSAEKDLYFPFQKDFNEQDMDRHEYNITFAMYDRDPSKIGGQSIFDQDYRAGMFGAALLQEQIAFQIMNTVLTKAGTGYVKDVELLNTTENNWETPLDDLSLFNANSLRQKLRQQMSAEIKVIVPYDLAPLLSKRYQNRETDLGDRAFNGTIFDRENNVRYIFDIGSPVSFKLAVAKQPTAGDTLTFGMFSNHSAIKFIAASNTVTPGAGEVKIGSTLAATKTNIINYLTDQTQGLPTATSAYGARLQYNLDTDDVDARNLQRQELRFEKPEAGNTDFDLIVYGSGGRIEPTHLKEGAAVTDTITISDVKGKALYVADGGMARYKIFDTPKYMSTPRENNLSIMNHQIWGTNGTFVTFGEAARFEVADISYSSALITRLGRKHTT